MEYKTANELNATTDEIEPAIVTKSAIVMTSDPQYPWSPALDIGAAEDESVTKQISNDLIVAQYNDVNAYTSTVPTGAPVFVNGDVTAFGHEWQRISMGIYLEKLQAKNWVYLGLGNHDYQNNVNDSYQNTAVVGMMNWYRNFSKSFQNIVSTDIYSEEYAPVSKFYNSFAYSVDLRDACVIQLHNYPTYTTDFEGWDSIDSYAHTYEYHISSNLGWIESQLKWAKDRGKIIFINTHFPYGWSGGPSQEFKNLITQYGVTAIFAGHFHSSAGLQMHTDYFGNIPVFLSGSASQSTYLIVEYDTTSVDVYLVTNNNHSTNKTLLKTIFVGGLTPGADSLKLAGNAYVIGNIYNNRMIDLNESTNEKTPNFYSWTGGTNQQFIFSYNKSNQLYQIISMRYPGRCLAIINSTIKLVPTNDPNAWFRMSYKEKYFTMIDGRLKEFDDVYFITTADSTYYLNYNIGYSDGRDQLGVSTTAVPFHLHSNLVNAPTPGPSPSNALDPLGLAGRTVTLATLYGKLVVDLNESTSDKKPELFPWTGGTNEQFLVTYNEPLGGWYQLISVRYPDKGLFVDNNGLHLGPWDTGYLNTYFSIKYRDSYRSFVDGVNMRFRGTYKIQSINYPFLSYDPHKSDGDRTLKLNEGDGVPFRIHLDIGNPPSLGGEVISDDEDDVPPSNETDDFDPTFQDSLGLNNRQYKIETLFRNRVMDINMDTSDYTPTLYPWRAEANEKFRIRSINQTDKLYRITCKALPYMALAVEMDEYGENATLVLRPITDENTKFWIEYTDSKTIDINGSPILYRYLYQISFFKDSAYINYDRDATEQRQPLSISQENVGCYFILTEAG